MVDEKIRAVRDFHNHMKLDNSNIGDFKKRILSFSSGSSFDVVIRQGGVVERIANALVYCVDETEQRDCGDSFPAVVARRRSCRDFIDFSDMEIDSLRSNLMSLMRMSLGSNSRSRSSLVLSGRENYGFRSYPSAGAIYPVMHYVLSRLDGGDYQGGLFRPWSCEIVDERGVGCDLKFASDMLNIDGSIIKNIPLILIQVVDVRLVFEKYGVRGFRFSLIEAGAASQSISLSANYFDFESCLWGGFYDDKIIEFFGLDEGLFFPVNVILVGRAASV